MRAAAGMAARGCRCGSGALTGRDAGAVVVGHKNYVPNMIAGAAQADVGILVISAKKGEFESGFEKGGQTREHAMLAKTLGVKTLIVVINKMDDPTVLWAHERYDECVTKLSPFLKLTGWNLKKNVIFLPISALTGKNIKEAVGKTVCPWYDGPTLFQIFDSIEVSDRDPTAPLRVPLLDRFSDRGVICMGKVEAGTCRAGDWVLIMPIGEGIVCMRGAGGGACGAKRPCQRSLIPPPQASRRGSTRCTSTTRSCRTQSRART